MMNRKRGKIAAALLAAVVAISGPATISAEELILSGTADLPEFQEEEMFSGAQEESQSVQETQIKEEDLALPGVQEAAAVTETTETQGRAAMADVSAAIKRSQDYLVNSVTNPVVDTLGGEWSVMAMARYNNRLTDAAKTAYLGNLQKKLDEKKGVLSTSKYTEFSRVIMALSAIGKDPSNVGGYNLLQYLADMKKVCAQGINGPVFALIALDTRNYEVPALAPGQAGPQVSREALIQEILSRQLPGGGWGLGSQPDDMTPMAIQALAPYYGRADVKTAVDKALNVLSGMQAADGGFSAAGGSETISQAVIALAALNKDLFESPLFVKNGNTMIDALLTYQMPTGAFEHVKGVGDDMMSTDQSTLALIAYQRAMNGQTRLYDMTDVAVKEDTEESAENVEAFRQALSGIPANVVMDHKDQVYGLITRLGEMGTFPEKEAFAAQLAALKAEIARQEAEVQSLDNEIWNRINPSKITLQDKPVVEELRAKYNNIPQANRKYVKYAQDLAQAEIEIFKLEYIGSAFDTPAPLPGLQDQGGTVTPGTPDQNVPGTNVVPGTRPSDNSNPSGNNPAPNKPEGNKPAPNKPAGNKPAPNKPAGNKPAGNKPAGNKPADDKAKAETGASDQTETNTVQAEVKEGVVEASSFENVKGTDKNLKMEGELEKDKVYTLTIHGEDVENTQDLKTGILTGSKFAEDIKKLAEDPFIFQFEEKGKFPGPMQVELPVDLPDGEYLLLKYNEKERKAEFVQKVSVADGKTKFILTEGGDYFIAKKAKSQSLNDIEAKEKEDKDTEKDKIQEQEKDYDVDDLMLSGTKDTEKDKGNYTWIVVTGIAVLVIIIIMIGGSIWLNKKRGRL